MTILYKILITMAVLGTSISTGQATIIDFNDITRPYSGNSLNTQGFNLFNDCLTPATCILHREVGHPYNADPTGKTFTHDFSHSTTTLTHINGNAFNLTSIDFADFFNNFSAQSILVVGTYASGSTISQTLTLQSILGLETFFFNWTNLISVSWTEVTGNWLQLDNIVLQAIEPQAPPSVVSEPDVFWVFLIGLLGSASIYIQRQKN